MKHTTLYICTFILLIVVLAIPVQAFTIKTLDISVQENRNANITFNYEVNWLESTAVFTKMVDPGIELKTALEAHMDKQVDVLEVTDNKVQVLIHGFSSKLVTGNEVTMTTPALSFKNAEYALNQYWFAPLISVDFSPELTQIIYPDGYVERYVDQVSIPRTVHTMTYE